MKRPVDVLLGANSAVRERFASIAGQSERTILLGTILLASAISAVTGFVLAQYYSIDVLSSLVFVPDDCYLDWGMKVGRHCFSDYTMPMTLGMRPNPWEGYPVNTSSGTNLAYNNYPAAGMLPHMAFGLLGKWLGAPLLGLLGYQLLLTLACLSPAVWAARGARGLERIVVFLACGIAAIPAWMMIDRGNSTGFVVPIALVFLVALCRRRWGLVTIMVILAALVKPQFAVLGVALFAARRWRWAGTAVTGVVISNLVAYALWPQDFPDTIAQSIHNILGYGGGSSGGSGGSSGGGGGGGGSGGGTSQALVAGFNVSFAKGLLAIPDGIKAGETGGTVPDGFLAGPRSLIGYVILVLVVAAVLALGRRIPPVMAGVVLLATASLFPALSQPYYLVFVLPVAALLARDPDGAPGTGIFDRLGTVGGRRRAVGVCVSLAGALSIAQIAVPGPPIRVGDITGQMGAIGAGDTRLVVATTVFLAPLVWLVACGVILVSYTRRSARSSATDRLLESKTATGVNN
ncbi:MAG TPA: glycosyltransferase family 87 protein [Mycobacterium sp.]|nr:glycosyltransferase family 87 protein [Mycobacterium sp.]